MEQTRDGITPAMAAGKRRGTTPHVGHRRLVWLYGAAALALIGVVIGALGAVRAAAQSEALSDAERATTSLADEIGPLLADAVHGDPTRMAELNQAIENRKNDGSLVHLTIWDVDGRVIYADVAGQIGRRLVAPTEVGQAISQGTVSSAFEVQPEVGNVVYDPAGPGFVEVYVPLQLPDQPRLAFEAYYDYSVAEQVAAELFGRFLPVVLGLLLLLIIQLPVAALARRLRRHRAHRPAVREPSGSAADPERIRVATEVLGDAVQDIAGVGYALGAVALLVPRQGQPLIQQAQQTLQRALGSLRQLTAEVCPLQLTAEGLPDAVMTLTASLRHQGIDVHTGFEPLPALSEHIVSTLYRAAHEALAAVAGHAGVSRVDIDLGVLRAPSGTLAVLLQLTDNGLGGPTNLTDRPTDEPTMQLLDHRLRELGGSLTVSTGPGNGTTIRIELPVDAGRQS